jgi:hypothetical protein
MNPLEERMRFPFPDSGQLPPPPGPSQDPEVARPERIDPATQGPAAEIPEPDWEGQEGVGPGRRDIVKRQEKGEGSLETPPPPVAE